MSVSDLSNQVALITGGSSGIGLAVAKQLAARGASVVLWARGQARLESAARELEPLLRPGARVEIASVDVSDPAAVRREIEQVAARVGPVDILVTSAGITLPGYFEALPDSVFRDMIEVDYFGTLHVIRAVAPSMMARGRGSIVGVSSAAGLIGVFGYSAYGPAKFAVRGLLESLRFELRPYGIHVGIAYPPDTDTPQLAFEDPYKPLETRRISGIIQPISADRMATAIVQGIERRRYVITADLQTALLARIGGLVFPILAWIFDRKIRQARQERGATLAGTNLPPASELPRDRAQGS